MTPQPCLTAAARSCVYTQSATRKWDRNNETLLESPNNDRDTPIAANTILSSYKSCRVFLRIVFKVLTSAKMLRLQAESIKKSLHGSYTLQECPSTYQLYTVDTEGAYVIFALRLVKKTKQGTPNYHTFRATEIKLANSGVTDWV